MFPLFYGDKGDTGFFGGNGGENGAKVCGFLFIRLNVFRGKFKFIIETILWQDKLILHFRVKKASKV